MTNLLYRRIYLRYPMHYPAIFGWDSYVGEGRLTNLSFSGCSVLCDRTPLVGTTVRICLLLPDHTKSLPIEGGTIKWAAGQLFGMGFGSLPRTVRQRLNHTLRQALIHRLQKSVGGSELSSELAINSLSAERTKH